MRKAYFAVAVTFLAIPFPQYTAQTKKTAQMPAQSHKLFNVNPWHPSSVETGKEVLPQDEGFLECAAYFLKADFRHGNTEEVFKWLSSNPNHSGEPVIVGHGAPRLQCTGNGDNCPGDDTTIMAYFNELVWGPLASKIQRDFKALSILGCDVGQGDKGADFLYAMAKAVQCPVKAPDSLIFCGPDGITLETGGQWVQATPSTRPSPHARRPYTVGKGMTYKFKVAGRFVSLPSGAVKMLRFEHRSYRQRELEKLGDVDTMSSILGLIDFGKPFETKGRPAAIVTGKFTLHWVVDTKTTERDFILYNDELVEDAVNLDVFYRADTSLADYIIRLTR